MEIAQEELNGDSVPLPTGFARKLCFGVDNDGNCSIHSDSDVEHDEYDESDDEHDEYYDGYSYNWSLRVTDSIAKGESVMVSKIFNYSFFCLLSRSDINFYLFVFFCSNF